MTYDGYDHLRESADAALIPPPIGTIVHVNYDPHISNADRLPCRAAIVTGAPRQDGLPVQVVPAWSVIYPAKVKNWHHISDCTRGQL